MSDPVNGSRFCPNCGRPVPPLDRFCLACGVSVPPLVQYPSAPVNPYPAPPSLDVYIEYAGFWRRFGALLIDSIMLGIAAAILMAALGAVGNVVVIIGQWLYFALMESSELQATVGKLALGIIVTDTQGRRIGFGQATGRYFAKIISSLILCIGYMMAGWTERKQGLHDMMADCLVICKW